MRYVNRLLGWFRASAKTVGLSPKILAPTIAAGLTAGLAGAGLTPHDVGQVLGVSDEVATAGVVVVGSKIALWLLPPGDVIATGEIGPSSDELMAANLRVPRDQ